MFQGCEQLENVNLRWWWMENIENMSSMFSGCSNLTSIDISSWDVSKVRDMGGMFGRCSNLTNLNLGISWLNPNIMTSYMFANVTTTGTFIYNPAFDYSKIIDELPATWTAQPRVINNQ